jgi:hypothetical protein
MKDADRSEVLAFLKLQAPRMVVHEVTAENRMELGAKYRELPPGSILWEIRARNVIGVLYDDPPGKMPLTIELCARGPVGQPWTQVRVGDAVLDDGDRLAMRLADKTLTSAISL